ncbi:Zinc transporter 5, partial [Pseudocercospora fuligena]
RVSRRNEAEHTAIGAPQPAAMSGSYTFPSMEATTGTPYYTPQHSRDNSYARVHHLSPNKKAGSNGYMNSGGSNAHSQGSSYHVRKAGSNHALHNSLHTLSEVSNETTPVVSPSEETYHPALAPASRSWFSLPEALTSLLIPLPYLLVSAAYGTSSALEEDGLPPLSAYARLQKSVLGEGQAGSESLVRRGNSLVEACTLTSGTLLLVGIIAKMRSSERMLDRRKDKVEAPPGLDGLLTPASVQKMVVRSLGVGLPYYAATQIGGMRTGIVLLIAMASGLANTDAMPRATLHDWKHILSSRIGSLAAIVLAMLLDFGGVTFKASFSDLLFGYLALACSIFFISPPLPTLGSGITSQPSSAITPTTPVSFRNPWKQYASSPLVSSVSDVNITLAAGAISLASTVLVSGLLSTSPSVSVSAIAFSTLAIASSTAAILFAQPSALRSQYRAGPGSLIYGILSEKDSRRIAYFTCLNFGFMIVQGIYGYLSGSLGLLSDTVHMFFDCLGLVVGLGAAVASKWPTSPEMPYGWGKLNTLAGFGNGIFLMLVSIEFVWEAMEGIVEQKELRHVQELLVVSTLGFLVNMSSNGTNGDIHGYCDHTHDKAAHSHDHGHDHHNDNMHGIFLHVAADAGGSAAVIISTALTLWKPWYLWDPLATIIIAILIFAAAVPLVVSSGQKLLLVIPDQLEYSIKNTLQELGEMRGVVGYAVPRFWIDDKEDADSHGHHHHGHDHGGGGGSSKVQGVIHVIANPAANVDDVRHRVDGFLRDRQMNCVVHVEREGDHSCWCGGGPGSR